MASPAGRRRQLQVRVRPRASTLNEYRICQQAEKENRERDEQWNPNAAAAISQRAEGHLIQIESCGLWLADNALGEQLIELRLLQSKFTEWLRGLRARGAQTPKRLDDLALFSCQLCKYSRCSHQSVLAA